MMNRIILRLDFWLWRIGRLALRTSAIFFVISALIFANAAFAFEIKTPGESSERTRPRVFVLSVVDYRGFDKDDLQGLNYDLQGVKYFFQRHVPEHALKYSEVDPNDASSENVADAIEKLKEQKVGRNDVVFFYYSGHAAYDFKKNDAFFILSDAKGEVQALYRAEVKKRLRELNARLVVIFTDCCNTLCALPEGMAYNPKPTPLKGETDDFSPVVKRLFVDDDARGIVDLTSSIPGEYSFAFKDGSVATTVAIRTLEALNKDLEGDPSIVVDWSRFVDDWTRETEDYSFKRRQRTDDSEQKKQTPYVYELPESVRARAFSGIAFSRNVKEPLKVASVKADSPASRAGVQADDVVKRFDGKEIAAVKDYREALANAFNDAELVVWRNGKLIKLNLEGLRCGQ